MLTLKQGLKYIKDKIIDLFRGFIALFRDEE